MFSLFRQTALYEFDEDSTPDTAKWNENLEPRISNLSNVGKKSDRPKKKCTVQTT